MLVVVGVCSTTFGGRIGAGSSVAVFFVLLAQEQRTKARAATSGVKRTSFFINGFDAVIQFSGSYARDGAASNFSGPGDRHLAAGAARQINCVEHFHEIDRLLRVIHRRRLAGDGIDEVLHL